MFPWVSALILIIAYIYFLHFTVYISEKQTYFHSNFTKQGFTESLILWN